MVKALNSRALAHAIDAPAQPPAANGQICIPILESASILEARRRGRNLASEQGFSSTDCTLIATAISELARNIVLYAKQGEIQLCRATKADSVGIVITATDKGSGIHDIRSAMQDGFSTSRGFGLGLPGVKRIMDELEVVSIPKIGTTVTAKKWRQR